MRSRILLWAVVLLPLFACGDTTGGGRVNFAAAAAGPQDATGGPLHFLNDIGYDVTLTRAKLHVGAMYLNQTVPTSGSQETGCTLPGIYVAQVPGSLEVDALSPALQLFATPGEGIASPALAGELWLTGGDINTVDDPTVILDAAGTASLEGVSYPFEAQITIGRNRLIPSTDPAFPGANPICKQRIVSLIPVDLTPRDAGMLVLRIDPRGWFLSVDFSGLRMASSTPLLYRFADKSNNPADISLFANGLRVRSGVYNFSWQ